ncbi:MULTISPECIES: urease accessory protein UreE [Devosia]|jgi:urease accessory protein|uniref:Urease accessory protein UreE n=1 Tax=Devosia litorisediminis TaxID=2829817 RepID=A0A942ICH2_9HYPH|nr:MULTISPECIES: urease accessory protein UreE [Devosia]MBS3847674.1 urease accessory protein UreE [Devosia litorisediminis]MCZ4345647.1 urease accessory protein UreE [Devosia neptuniae]|tara:strand:+ start:10733 stop:11197 length:465 start_codon:yes stop_codon:yes gene_type:complete
MLRAVSHLPASHDRGAPIDSITLAHDERRLRRKLLTCAEGTEVMVDFPATVTLEHNGALELEDGRIIAILAAPELLYQIRASSPAHLVRLAWHIGNRHTSAQLEEARILIKRDHVLKTMLEGLGADITDVTEPFFAEHGAYHSHADTGHALLAR